MRSRPHVLLRRTARQRLRVGSSAGGSVTSSQRRFASSYLTTSNCGTTSAGRSSTAEQASASSADGGQHPGDGLLIGLSDVGVRNPAGESAGQWRRVPLQVAQHAPPAGLSLDIAWQGIAGYSGSAFLQPPGQREHRQQRMAQPAPGAPQPGHEDLPVPARLPDITPVPRPEHQRPGTRRAVRAREPQIAAAAAYAPAASGHGHTMATGDTASDSFSRPHNTGVPDPRMCRQRLRRPAPAACARQAARCVRRRAAREAPFRNKRRSANAGDAEADA